MATAYTAASFGTSCTLNSPCGSAAAASRPPARRDGLPLPRAPSAPRQAERARLVAATLEVVADLRGVPAEELATQTSKNAAELFSLPAV